MHVLDDLNTYQLRAHDTAIYPSGIALAYVVMGLVGEAGELANKVKKIYRDSADVFDPSSGSWTEIRKVLMEEAGDVLWYLAEFCTVIEADLAQVAGNNLDKLQDRKDRGVLGGSGDTR